MTWLDFSWSGTYVSYCNTRVIIRSLPFWDLKISNWIRQRSGAYLWYVSQWPDSKSVALQFRLKRTLSFHIHYEKEYEVISISNFLVRFKLTCVQLTGKLFSPKELWLTFQEGSSKLYNMGQVFLTQNYFCITIWHWLDTRDE